MNTFSIKLLAEADRPREKALASGIRSLSNSELLAILIGSGSAKESAIELSRRILTHIDQDLHQLAKMNADQLQTFRGIGAAKAVKIEAALEIGRRRQRQEPLMKQSIRTSRQAYDALAPHLMDLMHEEFWVLFCNRKMIQLSIERLSAGGMHGTVVDPKVLFQRALINQSFGIILAHNHPSGNAKPSMEDIRLTKRLKEAAELLDMKILDHLIIYDQSYFSFRDEGEL